MKKERTIVDVLYTKMFGWTGKKFTKEDDLCGLIAEMTDLNMRGCTGETALMWASFYGHYPIVEWLLAHKADITLTSDVGYTALHYAVQENRLEVAELLLKKGANPNARDKYGNTPLFRTNQNRLEMIKLLLVHGADPTIPNNSGISVRDAFTYRPEVVAFIDKWRKK
ncbi:MAG: ankyrin repeat domain-containing protein [Clostridia bacterium]|nr:ankyrin repeat domain-containing protein [Clostridia bacterium]